MFEAGFVASIGSIYRLTAIDEAARVDGGGNGSGVKPCTTIEDIVITAPKRTPTSADEDGGTLDCDRMMCCFFITRFYS